jgi:multicomponent Na+:H+ antiporter subunit B
MPMRENLVLRVVAGILGPFILLFALYVQFHGDFGPGGGFQAGVVFAAGLILYALIFGLEALRRLVPPGVLERVMAIGVLLYGGVGVVTLLLGGEFLDYDVLANESGQHWGIFLVELGVGITVAGTMATLFFHFAGYWEQANREGDGPPGGGG